MGRNLRQLTQKLKEEYGVHLDWTLENNFHDRMIETDTHEIILGAGLDYIRRDGRCIECNIFVMEKPTPWLNK